MSDISLIRCFLIPHPMNSLFSKFLIMVIFILPPASPTYHCESVAKSFTSSTLSLSALNDLIACAHGDPANARPPHPASAFYLGMHHVRQGNSAPAAAAFLTCYQNDGGSSACLVNYINTAPLHDMRALATLVTASTTSPLPLPPHHLQENIRARLIAAVGCMQPFPAQLHSFVANPIVACAAASSYAQCCVGWPPDKSQVLVSRQLQPQSLDIFSSCRRVLLRA
jgi:hypothetical protein